MSQPPVILQELLTALTNARRGTTLELGQATLGPTSAAALLDLFSNDLQIASFTLNDVRAPGFGHRHQLHGQRPGHQRRAGPDVHRELG